jgi:hypothetical protein
VTIDIRRLSVDLDYWDKVAPNGASHFMYSEKFVKWVDGVEWVFYTSSDKAWKQAVLTWPLQKYTDNGNEVVAKPSKPAAPEWDGEGLSPVGTECEVNINDIELSLVGTPDGWRWCEILAHRDDCAIVWIPSCNVAAKVTNRRAFRPIRSQKQTDLDNIEEDLLGILPFCEYTDKQIEELAEILYSLGYRKPVAIK